MIAYVLITVLVVETAYLILRSRTMRPDRRIAVLEALLSGPKLGAELPLPASRRYVLLARMKDAGLLRHDYGHVRNDGRYVYTIAPQGLRLLGEQDR